MTFTDKLTDLMKNAGLNKSSFSKRSDIPYSTIDSYYKRGYENAGMSTLRKIADFFDVSVDYLILDYITDENYGKCPPPNSNNPHIEKYLELHQPRKETVNVVIDIQHEQQEAEKPRISKPARKREKTPQLEVVEPVEDEDDDLEYIKIIQFEERVSAGNGVDLDNDRTFEIAVVDNRMTRNVDFVLVVCGNSMIPEYFDGDLLMVKETPEVNLGEIGIFILDGQGFVKVLGDECLISLNPNYDDIPMDESIRCVGKVLGKLDRKLIK